MKVYELIKELENYPHQDAEIGVNFQITLAQSDKIISNITKVNGILKPLNKNDNTTVLLDTEEIRENI
ncbi:hypothetical protein [Heyndrickxia coagulans]|uniref:Uncharacterized protein n=1 Tax=Heyndrickxia coagulans DSM 1 = ATCC 7050 TaxID=1121088 RepID=A0A0B5X668_HEYCO|nr:hypothetical protein [Heyndrickxia coagulans]AJH78454.1 hypothetical protein BF29_2603 [Heyndrickxia coagulans DSM 1 = ATCC 7050]AJH78562.1 hypothetical protein BF29_2526 [Heyndrickxia coagulans DSM 1 = ATCC 7050]MCR2847685.1 hypothetical protein [Heyndrickxia coagulans]MDR4225291.1 hypothetical protein [Heyndrickxia coagulans DSM 1 = ATCC 7050]MED4492964.1 hypothetical protein [Heyndrickxia coagulans]